MERMKQLFQMFLLPIIILAIHVILSFLGIYDIYWWTDVIMHFTGGVVIGMSYILFLRLLQKEGHIPQMKNIIFFAFVTSLVALTVVMWEFAEFSSDQIIGTKAQVDLIDTMHDLFLGLSGSVIGYVVKRRDIELKDAS